MAVTLWRPASDADVQSKSGQLLGGKADFVLHCVHVVDGAGHARIDPLVSPRNSITGSIGARRGQWLLIAFRHLELAGWAIALSGVPTSWTACVRATARHRSTRLSQHAHRYIECQFGGCCVLRVTVRADARHRRAVVLDDRELCRGARARRYIRVNCAVDSCSRRTPRTPLSPVSTVVPFRG